MNDKLKFGVLLGVGLLVATTFCVLMKKPACPNGVCPEQCPEGRCPVLPIEEVRPPGLSNPEKPYDPSQPIGPDNVPPGRRWDPRPSDDVETEPSIEGEPGRPADPNDVPRNR